MKVRETHDTDRDEINEVFEIFKKGWQISAFAASIIEGF